RRAVFVSDVRLHPHFANFKDLIVLTSLRASWSSPIMSHDGRVLGTFGMFYREVREPGPAEIQMIDYASRIAGIAIERKRAEEKLRQDERELRQLIDFLPQHVLVLDTEGSLLQANQVLLDYNGHTLEEMQGAGSDERHKRDLHPDDLEQTEQRVRNENLALREQIDRDSMFEDIVGSSEALRKVLRQVGKVARSDSTVLILGETGTGKELIARAIHKRSNRGERAFI